MDTESLGHCLSIGRYDIWTYCQARRVGGKPQYGKGFGDGLAAQVATIQMLGVKYQIRLAENALPEKPSAWADSSYLQIRRSNR